MNRGCLAIALLSVAPIIVGIVIGVMRGVWCGILTYLVLVLVAFVSMAHAIGKAVKHGQR